MNGPSLRAPLLLLAVAAVVLAGGRAAAAEGQTVRRFALVVGSNDGGEGRVKLRYAGSDAEAFASVMGEMGGVAEGDRVTVLDADPDRIRAAFLELAARIAASKDAAKRTEVVFYYSGHSDEQGLLPRGKLLSYKELRRLVKSLPADVRIAVLDSCASGALIRTKGGKHRPGFLADESSKVKGHAIITSSSADELSQESDKIGGSFFTHHLVSGLRGAADTTGDGRVTLAEAYQYAFHETLRRTESTRSGPQHANYDISLAGAGDVVITDIKVTSARLVLASALEGRLYVRDAAQRLVVEVAKARGKQVDIGLAPGPYKLLLHRGDAIFETEITLARGESAVIADGRFQPRVAEVNRTRGGDLDVAEPAEPPPGEPSRWVPVDVAFFPGLGIHGLESSLGVRHFSYNLFAGTHAEIRGAELGLVNIVTGDVSGFHGGAWNHVHGDVSGVSSSVVGSWAGGSVEGVQLGGAFTWAEGGLEGLQMAGAFNVAGGLAKAVQMSAVANVADGIEGAQITAGVNVAEGFSGVQMGLINVTGKGKGLQLGLINVADELDGEAVGLLSFVDDGYSHFEVWASDTAVANIGYKLGGRHLYTLFHLGVDPFHQDRIAFGAGLGGHIDLEPLYVDVDVLADGNFRTGAVSQSGLDPVGLFKLRVTLGYAFAERFALFLGLSLNTGVVFTEGRHRLSFLPPGLVEAATDSGGAVAVWPGFFVGARF